MKNVYQVILARDVMMDSTFMKELVLRNAQQVSSHKMEVAMNVLIIVIYVPMPTHVLIALLHSILKVAAVLVIVVKDTLQIMQLVPSALNIVMNAIMLENVENV